MPTPEYMRLKLNIIPDEIIAHYNLRDLVNKYGWVYIEIRKGMNASPRPASSPSNSLKSILAKKGYYQCQHTPGLWWHVWRSIIFCLIVNDFGIKVTHKLDMIHLKEALEEHYTVAVDWEGTLFCRVKLTWDYINRHVNTHMPGYIPKALTK